MLDLCTLEGVADSVYLLRKRAGISCDVETEESPCASVSMLFLNSMAGSIRSTVSMSSSGTEERAIIPAFKVNDGSLSEYHFHASHSHSTYWPHTQQSPGAAHTAAASRQHRRSPCSSHPVNLAGDSWGHGRW